tara:strand:- start:3309 stop:3653 length:345 start_codon:yes stop_codon:yes gene_type:complete
MSESTKLLATVAKIDNSNFTIDTQNMISIDTSNNRIGINTLDPSYSIDILGNEDISGIIRCEKIIAKNIKLNTITDDSFNIVDLFNATKQLYIDLSAQPGLVDNSMNSIYKVFR